MNQLQPSERLKREERIVPNATSAHFAPAISALVITSALLLIPGPLSDWLLTWAFQWWPWPSSEVTSSEYPVDKFVHAVLFGFCGYLFCKEWIKTPRKVILLYGLLFLYGLAIELLQIPIPGRGGSVGDLVADSIGLVLGFYLAMKGKDMSGKLI